MQFDKPLYTVPETLNLIRIGLTKFYEEVNAGRIPVVKAGHRTFVPAKSISTWIESLPVISGKEGQQ